MTEDMLLTSPLEYTNEPYALAKIAGLKMCESYNLQYGTNYVAVMPTNLYGPNDNFHLQNSHVLPAMMRKLFLARLLADGDWKAVRRDLNCRPLPTANGESSNEQILAALADYGITPSKVSLWGTGTPLREFLWSEDMADASVHVLLNVNFSDLVGTGQYSSVLSPEAAPDERGGALPALGAIRNCHINVGTGKEVTIARLANLVAETVGFHGEIFFDSTKPDGTPRKLTDVSKLHALGWTHSVELDEGVRRLYSWYQSTLK